MLTNAIMAIGCASRCATASWRSRRRQCAGNTAHGGMGVACKTMRCCNIGQLHADLVLLSTGGKLGLAAAAITVHSCCWLSEAARLCMAPSLAALTLRRQKPCRLLLSASCAATAAADATSLFSADLQPGLAAGRLLCMDRRRQLQSTSGKLWVVLSSLQRHALESVKMPHLDGLHTTKLPAC